MKGKVLIVDDDPVIVTILEEKLQEEGFETASVFDGKEALERIHELEPEIVISDIMMPRIDGYELHRRIRSDPSTASIPFVFLSAKAEPTDQLEGLRMGADEYVCKPFEFNDLIARMKKAMRRVERARAFNSKADFSGNVSQMGLVDVLQIVEINHKTGELVFNSSDGKQAGRAFFQKGALIDARLGKLRGTEAFYGLMGKKEGYFEFFGTPVDVPKTISMPNMSILLNGSRLLDEAAGLDKLVSDFDCRLHVKSRGLCGELEKKIGKKMIDRIIQMAEKGASVSQVLKTGLWCEPRAAAALHHLLSANILGARKAMPAAKARMERKLLKEMSDACSRGLTGTLEIADRPEKALIYFEKGRIVHAFCGMVSSKKAIYRILRGSGGRFVFTAEPVSVIRSIKNTGEQLIRGAQKEFEELAAIDAGFFESTVAVNARHLEMIAELKDKKYLARILALAQQYDAIKDVLEASPYTDLATCKALIELIKLKAVRVCPGTMRKVRIVTDGAADLPAELAVSETVEVLPCAIKASGSLFLSSPGMSPENFYDTFFSHGPPPAVAAPSTADFDEHFRNIVAGADILAVLSAEKTSESRQNAEAALKRNMKDYMRIGRPAKNLSPPPRLEIVDGGTTSAGLGLLVSLAARKLEEGNSFDQVKTYVEKLVAEGWTFVVTKNGNLFSTEGETGNRGAQTGDFGKREVIYTMKSGKVVRADRLKRGESAPEKVAELFGRLMENPDSRFFAASIAHADDPETAEHMKNLLELNFGDMRIQVLAMGTAFGALCGPGAFAIGCFPASG